MKKVLATVLTVATILATASGCRKKLPKFDFEVGDLIDFGKYQKEDIEWEVMYRNFVIGENKVIVEFQSTHAIDCMPFNEDGISSWEDCSLRDWLNSNFYEEAFTETEKKRITDTTYSMYTGETRWLTDKVCISGEFSRFHMTPQDAICSPSKYAKKKGIRMEGGSCMFWTREVALRNGREKLPLCLGTSQNCVELSPDPATSFTAEDVGVRPWISIEFDASFSMKDIHAGDRVTFGSYDGDPITWIVIESGKDGLQLLSKYGLEKMKMDKDGDNVDFADTDLHDWLNEDFYEEAFTKSEKKQIVADDEDDNVTLIENISIKDGFERECMYELLIGNGYSQAYCDRNEVPEKEAIDIFWCKGISKKNNKMMIFNISMISSRGVNSDEEYSVRPYITITF